MSFWYNITLPSPPCGSAKFAKKGLGERHKGARSDGKEVPSPSSQFSSVHWMDQAVSSEADISLLSFEFSGSFLGQDKFCEKGRWKNKMTFHTIILTFWQSLQALMTNSNSPSSFVVCLAGVKLAPFKSFCWFPCIPMADIFMGTDLVGCLLGSVTRTYNQITRYLTCNKRASLSSKNCSHAKLWLTTIQFSRKDDVDY